ncbi:phosphate propanoyltransferase [Columbia Basin potato purple top phytoplasma]|uniref:Phosphate propanoyltransferase n=1 Tax=Columbia Basin potato purple top phytoplasma TaxID=307134 RepID=A0ABT5LAE8_9MOLU|nr:phosphate propanoyltransferase [Columbia Basin potato purple top phytoplasma]MDC9031802.1 phosphate propanoyltransferase [Columbia Basin potato purple top phytoplasma]
MKLITLGISGRHAHLSQKTLDILFGTPNYKLTFFKDLKQKGQYASEEKIDIMSSSGQILKNVRILGPVRNLDQIEISQSDNLRCKFEAPVRSSGDIKNSASATLIGPKGKVEIKEGVIIADRHIHFSLEEANEFNVFDKQVVNIEIDGIKSGILGNVLCRVDKNFSLECHLDTDDASAFLLKTGDKAKLINPKII